MSSWREGSESGLECGEGPSCSLGWGSWERHPLCRLLLSGGDPPPPSGLGRRGVAQVLMHPSQLDSGSSSSAPLLWGVTSVASLPSGLQPSLGAGVPQGHT